MKIIVKSGSGEKKERHNKSQKMAHGVGHLHPWKQAGTGVLDPQHQENVNRLFCLSVVFKTAESTFPSV